jgi:hypothetical protein
VTGVALSLHARRERSLSVSLIGVGIARKSDGYAAAARAIPPTTKAFALALVSAPFLPELGLIAARVLGELPLACRALRRTLVACRRESQFS